MGTLHMTISPFGATSLPGATMHNLLSPWIPEEVRPWIAGDTQRTRAKAAKPVMNRKPVEAAVPLERRGAEEEETGRDTLLPSKAEATVLSSVDDPAFRQEHAPVIDPAKAAEQEQVKRLVLLCISGDSAAWQQLVASQYRRIYAICYRFTGSQTDAEDLTQEVFLKLYRALGSFDPAKGAFQTWITTLTRNLLVDHFRRTRQDRATDSLDVSYGEEDGPTKAEQLADGSRNQHDHVAQLQLRARIQHALRQISPELREAVILRDLQDMDYKEISAVLRVPEGTVKSRISRGRGELARILGREGLNGATEGRMS